MALKLEEQLKEVGSKLETPPSSKDALIKLLKQASTCLCDMDQSPSAAILESMKPFQDAIVKPELLKHQDKDVKLLVATCICEITRITAPEAPYSDDVLKESFHLIVGTFSGLSDIGGPSFGRRVVILETLAKYRSCVVMLDLECDDLIHKMFSTFFTVASDDHQQSVLSSMQTIMAVLIEESEDVREDLLFVILSVLGRNRSEICSAARKLAMNVIEQCAGKLEAGIKQFLVSSMSGDNRSANSQIDYHEVIYDVYRCAPQILSGVVPYLTGELLTDQLDIRLKAVGLVGDLFALPGSAVAESFQPIFSEFLKRLSDRGVEVRMSVLERVKSCLLSDPARAEASQIISALCDRLLDYDENVRKQVVDVICDVACHALNSIPVETIKLVAERLRDKSLLVKRYTMERLAEIFRVYCSKSLDGSISLGEYDWIPGKILRCFYDRDFRSDTIEAVLFGSIFPTEFSVKDRVKHWVRKFSVFDKVEVKALEKILEQKQRLQQEMQKYLSLRQMQQVQDGDAPEIQKKVLLCFRIMARSFAEPAKAEENFLILDQLKDTNVWKILTNLLDADTGFHQACANREDILKILGEKHRLYDFLSNLSVKCSYLLFNKEHAKEILSDAVAQNSAGNIQYTQSCMDILVLLARFSPLLLGGAEEELVNLLKDDNVIIKEGVLHILAKAGGTIREQLVVASSSIDLILEKLSLEGSRRQAKYAVHALAAITKDDGLKSLSVLYKRLVDMLEEKSHLPAVLQSLGCIAETAIAVFETRETEIEEFIKSKILRCSNKAEDSTRANWDDRSEICLLKIYGIKTLVKSYLPVKDVQLRTGIDGLLEILRNVLMFGEISADIESSSVDKAHLRLASAKAVLRLSKQWDHKIPIDVFHLTLKTSEIAFPQVRKLFLSKVHQYIKDRHLDVKYACAYLFNLSGTESLDVEEEKQNLADIIQMHYQAKARQLSVHTDANPSAAYPEDILPYLVHALAHHSCPNVDECQDVKAYQLVYRQLLLVLPILVHKDEDSKTESSTNKEKGSISAVGSIFQSIKCSEDIVDAAKSKSSHAISDLGLSIIKHLTQREDDLQSLASSVSLPPMLYKPYEKKDKDDSVATEGKTWLADEKVLTQLEMLKLETDEKIKSDVINDEVLKDSETEESELPLGKIMEQIKAQGTKSGKNKKKKLSSAKPKTTESGVDILNMVREINLDNLGLSGKFESSNGHKHDPIEKGSSEPEHQKVKKRKAADVASVPVPKRRRSSSNSAFRLSSSSFNSPFSLPGDDSTPDSKEKNAAQKRGSTDSDLLVSCIRKNTSFTSKHRGKRSSIRHNLKDNEIEEDKNLESFAIGDADKIDTSNNFTSLTGSMKKRKRSVSGLVKCTTKTNKSGVDIEELIGFRVKIWWPLDKKFYEGTIKSYDPIKRKHVIKYDDGDIEVLKLEKERWELADNGRKRIKKSRSPLSTKGSPAKKSRSGGRIGQMNTPEKIVKRKRTPKKNSKRSKRVQKVPEDKEDSDVSNPESTKKSEGDEAEQGDSDAERVEEHLTNMVESDKEVASVSGGEHSEDTPENQDPAEESDDEVKSDSEAKEVVDTESVPEDAEKDDAEGASHSDDTEKDDAEEATHSDDARKDDAEESSHSDESGEASQEEVNKDGSSSEEDEDADNPKDSSPEAKDAELSDDEPLCNWQHKVKKAAARRAR